jgi:hypothetical protein
MGCEAERVLVNSIHAGYLSDQRRSTRFDYDMRLITRPTNNRARLIPGRIIDVSCGGIKALLGAELQVGDVHELEFWLRDTSAVVRLNATIRWREGCQYGMEFMYATASEREKISQAFTALGLLP